MIAIIVEFYLNILRKTIEGYLDSVPSLTFNTIKLTNYACIS